MKTLHQLLQETAALHRHLCPRQVLGVRMGMLAAAELKIELPQVDKRLLTIVETDGCVVDGISIVTGCTVGHRTLRIVDYGKIAATFVDTHIERALRLAPAPGIRDLAYECAPNACNKWEAHLLGYQTMPDERLFQMQEIQLAFDLKHFISRAGRKAICQMCGEEINNQREVWMNGKLLCRGCAGDRYYVVNTPVLPRQSAHAQLR